MKTKNNVMNYGIKEIVGKEIINKKIIFLAGIILFSLSFTGTAFGDVEVNNLLEGEYENSQCFLCYDICKDTVTDLTHEMYENITLDKRGKVSSKNTLVQKDVNEALKNNYVIKYSVYTDYLTPTFLKDNEGNLIDSRYRGKMMFLGEEYRVMDWDDNGGILKIAKGEKIVVNNKEFNDFTTKNGTYNVRIHRAIFSADTVAGIIIDVKKPDETQIQAVGQRSLNAIIGNIEIYVSNVATAGNFTQADIVVYDLSTKIILKDGKWFSDKKEWYVEMEDVDLGCLVNLGEGAEGNCGSGSNWISTETSDVQNKFRVYEKTSMDYGSSGMLKAVHLTLRTGFDFEPCSEDSECKTKNCVRSMCREKGYCGKDPDCLSGEYCSDNVCKTLKSIGSSCSENPECVTGYCSNNKCEKSPKTPALPPDSPPASSPGPPPASTYGSYLNNQCFLCYDICQDTVVDLVHEMNETIKINGEVFEGSVKDAVESAGEGDKLKYFVYTDYLSPTFLKNSDGNLIDSRYRGKMLFFGEEYLVKNWDDDEKTLEIAKGDERSIDNKEWAGDFTVKEGTYKFKIHRPIFMGEGENKTIAGVVIDVKKPDETEIQVVAQRSLNAVSGGVEIYVSNVATAGDFAVADVTIYDLSTEVKLKDGEVFSEDNEWIVELIDVNLGCLVYLKEDKKSECASTSSGEWETKSKNTGVSSNDREKFTDYAPVDSAYGSEGMLRKVILTFEKEKTVEKSGHSINNEESALQKSSGKPLVEGHEIEDGTEPEVEEDVEKNIYAAGLAGLLILGVFLFMVLVIAVYLFTIRKKNR